MIQTPLLTVKEKTHNELVGLASVQALFRSFNQQGVRYCHWKSNVRLVDAVNGRTDLDLLVDPAHQQQFRHILKNAGIVPLLAPSGKRYPGLEDYLGFDADSGHQFHLHVHYKLVLGEQFVKNYHLPLEKQFLDSAQYHHNVKIPAPELELIVLSIRALLKYRDRDVIKDVFTIRYPGIPDHIAEEIDWLMVQTSIEKVQYMLHLLNDVVPANIVLTFLKTIATSRRNGRSFFQLRQQLRQALQKFQRYPRLLARAIYFRELWRRRNTFLKFKPSPQMTIPGGGLTVALVGVDGAGKTTQMQAITKWLAWKLDVHPYYLGSKQPSWMSSYSYLFFRVGRRSHRELFNRMGTDNAISNMIASVRDTLLYSHYLFTGYDRYRRYLAGKRLAIAGSLVVYDRYPLEAPLDGPQIHLAPNGDKSRSAKLFSRWEQQLYRQMQMPDMLIVLRVNPELSLQRKPDHRWDVIVEKNVVLDRVTAVLQTNNTPSTIIDASQPQEIVLNQIKQTIWYDLNNNHDR